MICEYSGCATCCVCDLCGSYDEYGAALGVPAEVCDTYLEMVVENSRREYYEAWNEYVGEYADYF